MYSVIVPGAEALSQVRRHDWSFARQLVATQTAMDTQAGSFGQLVELEQQFAVTHVAHEEPAVLKICVAAGQLPPSPSISTPVSAGAPASPGGEAPPPPDTAALQGTPLTGLQLPIGCGFVLDEEHAKSAARAPARAEPLRAKLADEV